MTFRIGDRVQFVTPGERRTGQWAKVTALGPAQRNPDHNILYVVFESGKSTGFYSHRFELSARTPLEQMVHEYISAELK